MATFIDTNGKKYSEEDFNSRDSLYGAVFNELNLNDSGVRRLPKDLKVLRRVTLSETIEEISEGLIVDGRLTVSNSKVTRIPDNVTVSSLDISQSLVTSVGDIQFNHGELITSRVDVFKHKIDCWILTLTDPYLSAEFDLKNIEAHTIKLVSPGLFEIKNAECRDLIFFAVDHDQKQDIVLRNSSIYLITMGDFLKAGQFSLNLESSVVAHSLRLYAHEGKIGQIRINNPIIDEVIVQLTTISSMSLGCLIFENLVTAGDFIVQRLHEAHNIKVQDRLSLPSSGIVYGNMKVPKGLVLSESFCCFGDIFDI